jgi:myo-inositol-1-phosphate synthase
VFDSSAVEMEIVWQLKLWDRSNEAAYVRDEVVHAHLVLDRGFRDLKK